MTFANRTSAYLSWLVDSGVSISKKVQIADLRAQNQGRAVVAIEDIEEDEELFRIPRSLLINACNCSLLNDNASITEKIMQLPQWEALILVVLYEWKVKGESSLWFPYFQVLPVNDENNYTLNQLIYWSSEELALLKPSFIINRVGVDSAERMFSGMSDLLSLCIGEVSQEEFNAVASLIMSYSFDVDKVKSKDNVAEEEDEDDEDDEEESSEMCPIEEAKYLKSMVPLADTLNADTHAHNASLMYSDDFLIMRSIKKICKDEQVFNSYSQHPNAEILRRYGYVEPTGSVHDFAEISMTDLSRQFEPADKLDTAVRCLKQIQEEEGEAFLLDSYDCFASGEVIFELIFVVQLLDVIFKVDQENDFLSDSEEVIFKSVKRMFKKCYQLLESKKLTDGFLLKYKAILEDRLSQYPKEVQADLGKDVNIETREQQAKVVLMSEAASLKMCLDVDKVFFSGEAKYSTIKDDKLLKNILSKSFSVDETSRQRKKHKTV